MRVILAGGGTGGHINPALAIANAVKNKYPDSEILFIGAKRGMEGKLVPQAGYRIEFTDVEGFTSKNPAKIAKVLMKLARAKHECAKKIKEFKPDIVIGTGGYVSAPALLAAAALNIPTLIHEQNAIPGKTSRMLSKRVDRICVGFNNVMLFGFPEKTVFTGNPLRGSFKTVTKKAARDILKIPEDAPFILCVSGSLGAKAVNSCITDYIIKTYKEKNYYILAVTGDYYIKETADKLKNSGISLGGRIQVRNYINDMEKYLAAADIIISRAGALFMSEIAYLGKPSVLIPSPNVAENHQEKNADAAVKAGAAVKISEKDLTEESLERALNRLLGDKAALEKMAECSAKSGVRDSDIKILNVIEELVL